MARMTLEALWISATKLAPWRRNYTQSPKRQITQIVPFVGTKTVLFTGSFWGLTENSIHASNILIMNCEIIEEQTTPPTQPQTQELTVISDEEVNKAAEQQPYGGTQPPYDSTTHFRASYGGRNYWIKKIDMRRQPVLVRCSCSDYFFTWGYYNYINGVQFGGRQRPYQRKTSTRPPRNIPRLPGICKHLSGFSQMLQTSGFAI